jgi:hypothetical protein
MFRLPAATADAAHGAAAPRPTASAPAWGPPPLNAARVLTVAGLIGAAGLMLLIAVRGGSAAGGRGGPSAGVARYLRGFIAADGPARWRDGHAALTRPVEPRVLILKRERRLYLLDGGRVVAEWDVHLGFDPVGHKRCEGDGRTPEGTYYVCTRSSLSRYHRFLGISYPSPADADRGLRTGAITREQADAVRRALTARAVPPWNTPLGGAVGLHGTGGAAVAGDWTAGCIALSDEAIDRLFRVLEIGDPVEIRP